MFTDKIYPTIFNGVINIGGKYLTLKGIGTVIWFCTNDEEKLQTNEFNNALYFPESPVIILSATALSESMKDHDGTWVLTKRKYYIFT